MITFKLASPVLSVVRYPQNSRLLFGSCYEVFIQPLEPFTMAKELALEHAADIILLDVFLIELSKTHSNYLKARTDRRRSPLSEDNPDLYSIITSAASSKVQNLYLCVHPREIFHAEPLK